MTLCGRQCAKPSEAKTLAQPALRLDLLYKFEYIDLNIEVRKKYPVLMNIIEAEVDQDGVLGKPIR